MRKWKVKNKTFLVKAQMPLCDEREVEHIFKNQGAHSR